MLYGLKQSPRQWRKKLNKVMKTLGFIKSIVDNSLYFLWEKGTLTLIIVILVDDIIISSHKLGSIVCFKSWFGEHFELTDLDELKYMLGIFVEHNYANCLIYISQESYLKQILKYFCMFILHPVSISLTIGSTLLLY